MRIPMWHTAQSLHFKVFISSLLLLLIAVLIFIFYNALTFEAIQSLATEGLMYVDHHPLLGMVLFALFYFLVCALPTPFTSVFTMVAGYLFGHVVGLFITSFMSALGGTAMFLVVRYVLRDWVQQKVKLRSGMLQRAAHSNSFSVALSLRLIPGMPFPIPAVILGLSQLSVGRFYLSTQLGLLASLLVYVNAGTSLAQVHSIDDVLSPQFVISLLLLALLPLIFSFIQRKISIYGA
jgi:uncharacterized membrane protein YdjX (TVP38/TMEM64 family)